MKIKDGKLWAEIHNDVTGHIQIRTLTQADLDGALEVLDKSFFLHESVCNACGINLPRNAQARAELRELCRITAEDGVSLVAKDVDTGAIVSVSFNKIQYVPEPGEELFFLKFRNESTHSAEAQALMDFMIDVDGETDVFELYNIDCVCELMFLATLPEWERQGIARTLVHHSIELTRQLAHGIGLEDINSKLRAKRPRAVTALFTSEYSQKVGRSQGFKVVNSVPYMRFGSSSDQVFNYKLIDPQHKQCEHVILMT